jgi:uncharacterized membrane protein YsdA (DUF1294 family)
MRRISPITYFSIVTPVAVLGLTVFLLQMGVPFKYAYPVTVNAVAFGLYAYDKRQAVADSLRVPELWLHLAALAGGSPSALAGQLIFRHKTRKLRFQIVFWTIVMLQIAVVVLIWRAGSKLP